MTKELLSSVIVKSREPSGVNYGKYQRIFELVVNITCDYGSKGKKRISLGRDKTIFSLKSKGPCIDRAAKDL